jgi:choline dehydrogenase-like flavoprotein
VVDPDGQSFEVRDLYVADGSVLPTSLGVNPQLSIMAMATRIAWKLRERPLPS